MERHGYLILDTRRWRTAPAECRLHVDGGRILLHFRILTPHSSMACIDAYINLAVSHCSRDSAG